MAVSPALLHVLVVGAGGRSGATVISALNAVGRCIVTGLDEQLARDGDDNGGDAAGVCGGCGRQANDSCAFF